MQFVKDLQPASAGCIVLTFQYGRTILMQRQTRGIPNALQRYGTIVAEVSAHVSDFRVMSDVDEWLLLHICTKVVLQLNKPVAIMLVLVFGNRKSVMQIK